MIRVFSEIETLSRAAAELFVQCALEAVRERGRFVVALTGGSSPVRLHQLLAQAPFAAQVPWAETFVFWGDERWVPLTEDRSNARMAFSTLLDQVPIPRNQIFPMFGEMPPEEYALLYEKQLLEQAGSPRPRLDLILLGMGDDGHTASLFPGTAVLNEKQRWVQAYFLEPQHMYRITLTAPCLNAARNVVFLVFGENKAEALREVQEGKRNPERYPAQLIEPTMGEVFWLVDEAAARLLEKSAAPEKTSRHPPA